MIWCCSRCRGGLQAGQDGLPSGREMLKCLGCGSTFEVVAGIPDLRLAGDSWIDFEEDLVIARELAALDCTLAELVRSVYARRPGWDVKRVEQRTREVLQASSKLERDVSGWLHTTVDHRSIVLDLGCGAGMLIAAAAAQGKDAIGIDVSMTWLVVAKRLITEAGGKPVLAAALGEALPLATNSVRSLVSLDVIEHVRDPDQFLREMNRVVQPGGRIALSTPNRFSLSAEPHVFVWGVGWLPKRWQRGFVRWRSGKSYDDTLLMSSFGLRSRIRRNTSFSIEILIPAIPPEQLAAFRPLKRTIGLTYNRLASNRLLRVFFLLIGPFFRVLGVQRKSEGEPCAR